MALLVDGLEAGYSGHAVATLAHLDLGAGEAAALQGPSGSGKSTLLLAIAGLAQRLRGRVLIDGEDWSGLTATERSRRRASAVGFVFQDLHLLPGLSALENMLLAPFVAGLPQPRDRALALLADVGLAGLAQRRAERMSRGEAQRLAIARAMLLRPRLILADEPTASLDTDNCERVVGLLKEAMRATGAALLVASHDERLLRHFPKVVHPAVIA